MSASLPDILPDLGQRSNTVTVFAGPCSVESPAQFEEAAACVAGLGLSWIRGGAYKPRTNPHSFQGLGERALQIMRAEGSERHGLRTLTEAMDADLVDMVASYVDGLQVGARNFQNFSLLRKVGAVAAREDRLVMFKRGFAGTIEEWLAAAEYVRLEGCERIMLCERGIRTFETSTRFTLDISAVPVVHKQSAYPICVDVSHAAGQRDLVPALARAAVAAGADALMVEVHPDPARAKSDGAQQLTLPQFEHLIAELRAIAAALGKRIV
ncbi:3-deoxy-7-phosphoheptulonate synthase [Berryella wangjianweii]|uniref:3-deoxy-7-phosphoheptulonate synthase n=1 Tax=Berryella wangjianweii TaxID=2734634 RepID=A0A6M8IWH8_9ACTN|nr:3-deoxy-7-phosphoheptulonate synthase [Berryella wangjianweii]QKF07055.1 3-deoxy-7-phosphoheptulonate synthase [Berryella wangjianweii]